MDRCVPTSLPQIGLPTDGYSISKNIIFMSGEEGSACVVANLQSVKEKSFTICAFSLHPRLSTCITDASDFWILSANYVCI